MICVQVFLLFLWAWVKVAFASPTFFARNLGFSTNIDTPSGIAEDTSGSIYVSDTMYHYIVRLSTSGIVSRFAGQKLSANFAGDNSAATSGNFNKPAGMCFDTNGRMYIADGGNYRIRGISASGILTTIAGSGKRYTSLDIAFECYFYFLLYPRC